MGSPSRIRIGISACLLGQQVRYDGGHKRDAFLTDVLGSYVEWVSVCLFDSGWTPADLGRFHSAHEMLLLAHSPPGCRELGGLVASAGGLPRNELRAQYESGFMRALASCPSRGTHTAALMHMAGELEDVLDPDSKRKLLKSVDEYRRGAATLGKPLSLIRQHAMAHDIDYLRAQVYLEPDPAERMVLRSMSQKHDSRSSAQIRA